jgi:hypothetical protein
LKTPFRKKFNPYKKLPMTNPNASPKPDDTNAPGAAPDPAPVPANDLGQAKPVTAAQLVSSDTSVFPDSAPVELPNTPGTPEQPPTPNSEETRKSKRGGARPGAGRPKKEESTGPVFDSPSQPAKPPVDYLGMSAMMFCMGTSVLAQFFGPEWLPREGRAEQPRPGLPPVPAIPGEAELVVPCIARYLESKQMPDIPPGVMLTLVLASYAAPRFREPNTREKLGGVWLWIKSKLGRKKKNQVVAGETSRQEQKTP